MIGKRWYSLKHNTWAVVTDEPVTPLGYYTVQFDTGIYRRYNAERIQRELSIFESIDVQLAMQGIPVLDVPSHGEPRLLTSPFAFVSNGILMDTKPMHKEGKVINLVFAWRE